MSFQGKVALVIDSGKSPSIEHAQDLARQGATLALHYTLGKSRDSTLEFQKELMKTYPGIEVSIHGADLGSVTAVEGLIADVRTEHRRIDIVVNTAGMVLKKPTVNSREVDYDKMFAYAVFVDDQRRRAVDQFHEEYTRKQQS